MKEYGEQEIIQRSIQVPKVIWDASVCIPGGRTKFIIEALTNEIAARKTELPKLKIEVEEHKTEIKKHEALIKAKEARIAELEAENENKIVVHEQQLLEKIVTETSNILKTFRNELNRSHYSRLSELSGVPSNEIADFLKTMKYRPTDEQVREFYAKYKE